MTELLTVSLITDPQSISSMTDPQNHIPHNWITNHTLNNWLIDHISHNWPTNHIPRWVPVFYPQQDYNSQPNFSDECKLWNSTKKKETFFIFLMDDNLDKWFVQNIVLTIKTRCLQKCKQLVFEMTRNYLRNEKEFLHFSFVFFLFLFHLLYFY